MTRRSALLALLGASACLPEGGPGAGDHLLADRGIADLVFAREPAQTPMLFTRAGAPEPADEAGDERPTRELYLVGRAGEGERRLATGLPFQPRGSYLWDARGRLYIQRQVAEERTGRGEPARTSWESVRFDLASGDEQSLGRVRAARLSPARERFYYERSDGQAFLRALDDGEREVGMAVREVRFVGEDLHFVSPEGLSRLKPGDERPTMLAPGVTAFRPVPGQPAGTLVARRPSGDPAERRIEILRLRPGMPVETLASARPIGDPFIAPDGRRIAFAEPGAPDQLRVRLLDLRTGTEEAVDLPVPPPSADDDLPPSNQTAFEAVFRPGSDEVWCFVNLRLRVLRADRSVLAIDRPVHTFARVGTGSADILAASDAQRGRTPRGNLFTADGRRWIFRGPGDLLTLGNADDPASDVGSALGGPARYGNIVELEPGRRLAVWIAPGEDRQDLHVLDLDRERPVLRFLARDVGTVAFGPRRLVAIARKLGDRRAIGDLVVVELDSGNETLLAQNVAEFAFPPACAGCQPTDPGAALAYVVQARIPWRHEGIWMAPLP